MDLYSRLVAIFKVLLPLIALGILATLFLLSRGSNFEARIPFADSEVAERTRGQQITAPFYSGTNQKGEEIVVRAALARPGDENTPAEATEVNARLTATDGVELTLDSEVVRVDMQSDVATFQGGVRMTTSTGIDIETEELETTLQYLSGQTTGTISGTAPFGDLTAGRMTFGPENDDGPLHVLFNQGVKLIYLPKKSD